MRVQINPSLRIFKVALLMGDTNPFHPKRVKFQPLPVLVKSPVIRDAAKCPLYRTAALAKLGAASSCCLFSTEIREHRIASGSVVKGRHY